MHLTSAACSANDPRDILPRPRKPEEEGTTLARMPLLVHRGHIQRGANSYLPWVGEVTKEHAFHLWGYPEAVILAVVRTVSEGVNLIENHGIPMEIP